MSIELAFIMGALAGVVLTFALLVITFVVAFRR